MPIGTIMAYGGDTANSEVVSQLDQQGWLPCDGRVVTRNDYPELFNVIGTAFGNGTDVRVPDLRGRFLRGTDRDQAEIRIRDHAALRLAGMVVTSRARCKTMSSSDTRTNTVTSPPWRSPELTRLCSPELTHCPDLPRGM